MDTQSSPYSAAKQRQNILERAEARIIAKLAREFSAEAAGKKLDDSEDPTWVLRNVSFPFRSLPLADSPEMYELHSEVLRSSSRSAAMP